MSRHDQLKALLRELKQGRHRLDHKMACIGFDGYVDRIAHAVKRRDNPESYTPFETILEYAMHVQSCAGKSGDIEIVSVEQKLGGNAPIMAQALAAQGVYAHCIGMLGETELHPVFRDLSPRFIAESIGDPAQTIALEFSDGKLMLGDIQTLHRISWAQLKSRVGVARLADLYRRSEIIGIVNWSGIYAMESIVLGLLKEVFPLLGEQAAHKTLFIDIADPSARSQDDLLRLLTALREVNAGLRVVLGLNRKEARLVYEATGHRYLDQSQAEVADVIRRETGLYAIVIHSSSHVTGTTAEGLWEADVFHVERPHRVTGGGDHFNAGMCAGLLLGLPMAQCLLLGNLTASMYVRSGLSPSTADLIEFGDSLLQSIPASIENQMNDKGEYGT